MRWEFNVDKANQCSTRPAGSAAPTGSAPRTASDSSSCTRPRPTPPRQKKQAIVKQAAAKAGMEMELKTVVASVFFGSDPANPDTTRTSTPTSRCTRRQFAPRPAASMNLFLVLGDRLQGEQVLGAQHDALAQRGVRPAVQGGRERDGSGQAGGPFHPDERPRGAEHGRHPARSGGPGSRASPASCEHRDSAPGTPTSGTWPTGIARRSRRPGATRVLAGRRAGSHRARSSSVTSREVTHG